MFSARHRDGAPPPQPAPAPAPAHHSRNAVSPKTSARLQHLPAQARNRPGEPYVCPAGYFEGKRIQAQLVEVQKGDRARKMAGEGGKDARQVDPPPVAQLHLRECLPDGSYSDLRAESVVSNVQLVCTVALYPYNIEYDESWPGVDFTNDTPPPSAIQQTDTTGRLAVERQYPPRLPSRPLRPLGPHAELTSQAEGGKLVRTMFGAHTVAAQLCRHAGAIYFIFDDLKIRRTGHFVLKYSVFLIDSGFDHRTPMPCIAETWGGVFAVFPSRTAPSLRESTELTKHLNACGLLARARRKPRRRDEPEHFEDEHEDDNAPPPSTPSSNSGTSYASSPPVSPLEPASHGYYDPVRNIRR